MMTTAAARGGTRTQEGMDRLGRLLQDAADLARTISAEVTNSNSNGQRVTLLWPPAGQAATSAANANRPRHAADTIASLRGALIQLHATADAVNGTLLSLLKTDLTSTRSGHLRTLEDQIGPPPNRCWEDEWVDMRLEALQLQPWTAHLATREHVVANENLDRDGAYVNGQRTNIDSLISDGWPPDRAFSYMMLHSCKASIARALREGDQRYAASTYQLCSNIFKQRANSSRLPMYTHLRGVASLASVDSRYVDSRLQWKL